MNFPIVTYLIPLSCSVDSTQSLSPNFMHSPPAAARAIGRQRRLTETSQGVGGGRVVELMGCSQVSIIDSKKKVTKSGDYSDLRIF